MGMKGKHHSKETKRKISLSHIGKPGWNKGGTVSEKTKEKISESLKKYFADPLIKEKLSVKHSGKNNWRYGKHWSLEEREKKSKRMLGMNNHQWKHGKFVGKHHYTKERDDIYDCSFNNKFKNAIRKRDNQICMLCGIHREKLNLPLTIHHINYDPTLTVPENCVSLCFSCHGKVRMNKQHWITFFQNILSEKYGYKYENNLIKLSLERGVIDET